MAKPLIKALASENSLAGRPRCRTTCNWENNFLKGNPPASRLSPQPPAPGRAMRSGKKAARPTFRPTPRLGEPTAIQPPRRTAPFPRPRGLVPRHSPVDGRDSGYGRVGRGGHSLCQRQGSEPPQMRVAVLPERSGDCGGTSTWQETWVLPSACSTEVTRLQKRP